MKNECRDPSRTTILFSIITLFMYHSFYVLISANIMKMMPNMRNSHFQHMNDRRGGERSIAVGSITAPFFVHLSEKEIKANVGNTVILNCRVQNINNYTVTFLFH